MRSQIEQILDDLYSTDPALRKHDKQLRELVKNLLTLRPKASIDSDFRQALRAEIVNRATEIMQKKESNRFEWFSHMIKMSLFKFVAAGIAVAAIAVTGTLYFTSPLNVPSGSFFDTSANIERVGSNAFGELANVAFNGNRNQSGGGAESRTAIGLGVGMGGDGGASSLIYPAFAYRYIYKGEEFTLPESPVSVLRRQRGSQSSADIVSILKQFNAGALNLDSFPNANLQNFTLIEPGQFGYLISVDLENGQININQNWQNWPDLQPICAGIECPPNSTVLRPEDVPAAEQIISIAQKFLSDHGISTDGHSSPFVMEQDWRIAYDTVEDKSQAYIPDTFSVVFPIVIDGQVVHDEGGNPTGLSVSVNIRYNRVVGVWSLASQRYQASNYAAENNKARIMSVAENGGLYSWSPEQAGEIKEVELGTPTLGLVRIYHGVGNQMPQELYVPSLIFPVTKAPDNELYFRKSVVVPLVKEILDTANPGQVRLLAE